MLHHPRIFTAVLACVLVIMIPRPAHAYEDRQEIAHGQFWHEQELNWYRWAHDSQMWWFTVLVKNSEAVGTKPLGSRGNSTVKASVELPAVSGHTPCAIPAYICMRESRYDIHAQNPVSSASGKYQFLDSTWAGFGGFQHAKDAPEWMQDEKARQVWAATGGAAWACC